MLQKLAGTTRLRNNNSRFKKNSNKNNLKRAYHRTQNIMKDYYEILGVSKDVDKKALKKAYHKLAMQYHPDRNKEPGADEKFKEISNAYSVLSNDQKRQTYDQFGEEGVNSGFGGGGPGFDPEEMFSQMFGQGFGDFGGFGGFGGQQQKPRRPTRTEDLVHEMQLPLEDFYKGVTKVLEYPRDEICDTCDGRGTNKLGVDKTCKTCKGAGQVKKVQKFGGSMFQSVSACGTCGGSGEHISHSDSCGSCHGKGVKRNKKILKVEVKPGTRPGSDVVFHGDANQYPGASTGDVIISLIEKPHSLFTRSGDDLYMTKKISLIDALTGYEFNFTHLDGRQITVKNNPNSNVISPNEVQVIEGEGMPGNYKKGNLYVQLNIEFPKTKLYTEQSLLKDLGAKQQASASAVQVEAKPSSKPFPSGSDNSQQGYGRYKKKRAKQSQDQQTCAQM